MKILDLFSSTIRSHPNHPEKSYVRTESDVTGCRSVLELKNHLRWEIWIYSVLLIIQPELYLNIVMFTIFNNSLLAGITWKIAEVP